MVTKGRGALWKAVYLNSRLTPLYLRLTPRIPLLTNTYTSNINIDRADFHPDSSANRFDRRLIADSICIFFGRTGPNCAKFGEGLGNLNGSIDALGPFIHLIKPDQGSFSYPTFTGTIQVWVWLKWRLLFLTGRYSVFVS